MKSISFYGASDDLIEVGGDVPGADEYSDEFASFVVAGLKVSVKYENEGVWSIHCRQISEDVPVVAENMRLSIEPRMDGDPGYSMRLDMDVPDDAYIVKTAESE